MQLQTSGPTENLTPRQLQLLKAIGCFQESRCYSPTIAELASELDISRSTAFEHISELRRKGLLSACPGKARSLRPTLKAQELLNRFAEQVVRSHSADVKGIPLAGKVAAGTAIEAIEEHEELSLSSHFAPEDSLFALEVQGESMIGEDIRDGDYVICRSSCTADNGQLVIAILDNENATLKRFYKEKNRVRLQPANDAYEPIYSENCRIEAVVLGLVRRF